MMFRKVESPAERRKREQDGAINELTEQYRRGFIVKRLDTIIELLERLLNEK